MQEQLALYHPERNNQITILTNPRYGETTMSESSREGVRVVKASFASQQRLREVSLLVRNVKHLGGNWVGNEEKNPAEILYLIWRQLKRIGLPVVDTFRLCWDVPCQVVVSDVTRNGEVIYDKHAAFRMAQGRRLSHPYDEEFKEYDLSRVNEAALEEAERASAHCVGLPTDDPLNLIYEGDQKWRLMILDIGLTQFASSEGDVRRRNIQHVGNFMNRLASIQNKLKRLPR